MTETTTHEAERDAEVLKGVLTEPKADETAKATPPRRARRATPPKTTGKSGKAAMAATAARKPATGPLRGTGKAPAKAATGKAAPPKADSNGSAPSARDGNRDLAVELVNLVAAHFKGHSKADQEKIANWIKVLPTGGRGPARYWPKGFARPTTSDWRVTEA